MTHQPSHRSPRPVAPSIDGRRPSRSDRAGDPAARSRGPQGLRRLFRAAHRWFIQSLGLPLWTVLAAAALGVGLGYGPGLDLGHQTDRRIAVHPVGDFRFSDGDIEADLAGLGLPSPTWVRTDARPVAAPPVVASRGASVVGETGLRRLPSIPPHVADAAAWRAVRRVMMVAPRPVQDGTIPGLLPREILTTAQPLRSDASPSETTRLGQPSDGERDLRESGQPTFQAAWHPETDVLPGSLHTAWELKLCQALGPAAPYPIDGVDSARPHAQPEATWQDRQPIPWQRHAQGEFIGPHRTPQIARYRLRPDDQLDFIYRLTRIESSTPYELQVGDRILIEDPLDPKLNREVEIQPDGMITALYLGQVRAAGLTLESLRQLLADRYGEIYENSGDILVTPRSMNTRLEDLRNAIVARLGNGGQILQARVTPEGTVQLPGIGSVCAIGLTIDELKEEINARYKLVVTGIEVQPMLFERAPRHIFVVGEVRQPGRYELTGPTTAMQAIALGGGWNVGGNLRQIVVFRRGEDWRLLATKLDLQGALYGSRPLPSDEIWLRDGDIVLVPKSPLLWADDFISLLFTRGIYAVVPFQGISVNFAGGSTLVGP